MIKISVTPRTKVEILKVLGHCVIDPKDMSSPKVYKECSLDQYTMRGCLVMLSKVIQTP